MEQFETTTLGELKKKLEEYSGELDLMPVYITIESPLPEGIPIAISNNMIHMMIKNNYVMGIEITL